MFKKNFREAFSLVWKNPFLWLFGFFTSFLINNEILILILSVDKSLKLANLPINFSFLKENYLPLLKNLQQQFFSTPTNLLILFLIIFISLFFFYLSSFSQGVLIKNTENKGKKIREWLQEVNNFSLKIFFINVLILLFNSFLFYLFIFKFNLNVPPLFSFIFLFIVFLITFILSFIVRYTICFICLEKKGLFSSLKEATKFFFKNWLISVINSFLIFFVSLLADGLILFISQEVRFSFSVFSQIFSYFHLNQIIWLFFFINLSLLFIIFLIIISILFAWQYSVWGLLYLRIKEGKKED